MKTFNTFLSALFIFALIGSANSQSIQFYQDDLIFGNRNRDTDTTLNSYFGRVKLTFVSSDTIKYFNLSVAGNGITNTWPIKNLPVISLDSAGNTESRYFTFLISDTANTGMNVGIVDYGFSFTADSILIPNPLTPFGLVGNFEVILFNGFIDNNPLFSNRSFIFDKDFINSFSNSMTFDTSASTAYLYPVQNCGIGENLPAAFSDGALYLSNYFPGGVPLDTSKLSIEDMKVNSGWKNEGVYLFRTGHTLTDILQNSLYSNAVPIYVSPLFPAPSSAELDNFFISKISERSALFFLVTQLWKNPLSGDTVRTNYTFSIRSITKVNNDLYQIAFSHDATEGKAGGAIVEEGFYIPSMGFIKWSNRADNTPVELIQTDIGTYYIDKSDLPLPVEMSYFNYFINNHNVTLKWATIREVNNSGFEIQRTENKFNFDWQPVVFIESSGNTKTLTEYSYEDKDLPHGSYKYRLKQLDYNGNIKYFELGNDVIIGVPDKYSLSQNYPNPFNPVTRINYELPKDDFVSLRIYNALGTEVANPVNGKKEAGYYSFDFNAGGLSSGVYFYELTAGNFKAIKKMMLLK